MPFDASDFKSEPLPPERPRPGNRGAAALVIIISLLMMAMPFSLTACADFVHFLSNR